jgi:hypothetical protein
MGNQPKKRRRTTKRVIEELIVPALEEGGRTPILVDRSDKRGVHVPIFLNYENGWIDRLFLIFVGYDPATRRVVLSCHANPLPETASGRAYLRRLFPELNPNGAGHTSS